MEVPKPTVAIGDPRVDWVRRNPIKRDYLERESRHRSLRLTTLDWPGIDAAALQRTLLDKHHVLVQAMAGQPRTPHIRGIRISPNVYTSVAELDRFATALAAIVRR